MGITKADMARRRAWPIGVIGALAVLASRDTGFIAAPFIAAHRLSAAIPVLLGALPASAETADGGLGWQAIMMAPVISLFAIVGVAMVGGFVLGIFVPPGEGDYGNMETTLAEREARERGWRRDVLRGYDEETYAAMRGQDKDWAKVEYPFRKPQPRPNPAEMPKLPGAPSGAPGAPPGAPGAPPGAPGAPPGAPP